MEDARVLGIRGGSVDAPRVAFLVQIQPVTESLLAMAHPALPTEVFRFSARCEEKACAHFDGADCRLAQRIVATLPEVTDTLPPCQIRLTCRWWNQEGRAACLRCPQVVTQIPNPSEEILAVATPA